MHCQTTSKHSHVPVCSKPLPSSGGAHGIASRERGRDAADAGGNSNEQHFLAACTMISTGFRVPTVTKLWVMHALANGASLILLYFDAAEGQVFDSSVSENINRMRVLPVLAVVC